MVPGPPWCWARPGCCTPITFSALLLPALALFHLFFVRKERRWWQPVVLLGLAALLALPQAPDLLEASSTTRSMKNSMKGRWATLKSFRCSYATLATVCSKFGGPSAPCSPSPCRCRCSSPAGAAGAAARHLERSWYLSLTCTLQLLLLLVANEWLQVLDDTRVRYLATLWPPAVLLIGVALLHPKRALLRPPGGLVLVALMAFLGTSDYLYEGELTRSWSWRDLSFPIAATRLIAAEGSASGFLVVDRSLLGGGRVYKLYTGAYEKRRMRLEAYTTSDELLERAQDNDLVWLVSRSSQEEALHLPDHIERFTQDGWFHCRSWRDSGVALELLLAPLSTARGRLQFESAATLFAPDEPQLLDGRLRLRIGLRSDDETFLDRHSLAIHIIDSRSGERVAQADTGVGPGKYVPLCREIDISALPPGDYEVRVALYDWQTGVRLTARDLETGETGDMHILQRFRIG